MSKLLIIDKSVFHGTSTHHLAEFVKNHRVILPFAMVAECLMSKTRATDLLQRFQACVKSGAIVGMGLTNVLNIEKQTCTPITSVVDEQATTAIRSAFFTTDSDFLSLEAQQCEKTYRPQYDRLRDMGLKHFINVEKKKGLADKFQESYLNTPFEERLEQWLRVIDMSKMSIFSYFFPEYSKHLDLDWFTWHYIRLHYAWGIEWVCKRSASGNSYEQRPIREISNDYWDIEYVVCLSRADGMLSRDDKLVKPLTKAAFSEKDVFSSIEEVTEDYRCQVFFLISLCFLWPLWLIKNQRKSALPVLSSSRRNLRLKILRALRELGGKTMLIWAI